MRTGNLCRNKKFSLKMDTYSSQLFTCGRSQTIPMPVKKYEYGYKRKKQLLKAILVDALKEDWICNKDFIDFILGEKLINKIELLALVSTFDSDEYKKVEK